MYRIFILNCLHVLDSFNSHKVCEELLGPIYRWVNWGTRDTWLALTSPSQEGAELGCELRPRSSRTWTLSHPPMLRGPPPAAQSWHFLPELLHMAVLGFENLKLCDVNIWISLCLEYILKYCNSSVKKNKVHKPFQVGRPRELQIQWRCAHSLGHRASGSVLWAPRDAAMLWTFSEPMTSAQFCSQALML